MTSPVPRITNPALQSSIDDVLLQVDRDTVLKARAVFLAEADDLETELHAASGRLPPPPAVGQMGVPGVGVWVGRCSADPVSGPAQISFNRKIREHLQPCHDYIRDLRIAGAQLGRAAMEYGFTEQQVLDSFKQEK